LGHPVQHIIQKRRKSTNERNWSGRNKQVDNVSTEDTTGMQTITGMNTVYGTDVITIIKVKARCYLALYYLLSRYLACAEAKVDPGIWAASPHVTTSYLQHVFQHAKTFAKNVLVFYFTCNHL